MLLNIIISTTVSSSATKIAMIRVPTFENISTLSASMSRVKALFAELMSAVF